MKFLYRTLLGVWVAFVQAPVQAQQVAEVTCATLLETAVKPGPTLEASAQLFDDIASLERATSGGHRQIQAYLQVIYQPLFEAGRKEAEGIRPGKGAVQQKGTSAQQPLEFSGAVSGLSEEAAFSLFIKGQQTRTDFSCGHLPGSGTLPGLSGRGQETLKEILAINASLTWAALQKEAGKLTAFGAIDPALKKLNGWLSKEVAALPKKSIKMEEGFWHQMEDPAKAIALHRQFEAGRQQCFRQRFTEAYRLWSHYHTVLLSAAGRLDNIMQQTHFGNSLAGADSRLVPLLAGTQARILEMQAQWQGVARTILMEAQLAAYCQAETNKNIEVYTRYARGERADDEVAAVE